MDKGRKTGRCYVNMKEKAVRTGFLFCVLLVSILFVCNFMVNADPVGDVKAPSANHVDVYYFHGNFRCVSCHKIEQYTKEALEEFFGKELRSGNLVYKVVNVEQGDNAHFTEDYQLYTRSVVVSLVKDGKEVKYKNLEKVWQYLMDRQRFYSYIEEEISSFLHEL